MKNITLLMIYLIATFYSINSYSASITVETRTINSPINNSNFYDTWNNQSTKITTTNLDEFTFFRSSRDSLTHLQIDFSVAQNTNWEFQAGLDAHYGSQFYLDGVLKGGQTDDLWWSRNWNHSDVFNISLNSLAGGSHILDLYWAEKCCDGPSSLRFRTDGGSWQALSTENLRQVANVPEPSITWMLGLGLLAYLRVQRKGKAKTIRQC